MGKRLWPVLLIALIGCAPMHPEYVRPEPEVPESWPATAVAETAGQTVDQLPWRQFFDEPRLAGLIDLALEHNRDLRIAALNIERARARYGLRRAELWPQVDAGAAGSGQRVPADLSGSGSAATLHRYNVDLGLSAYELDLFGRIRSLQEQALADYLATEQARRGIRIGLVAEVAIQYLTLAADRELLAIARQTLESQQASYDLVRRRFEAGTAAALDLHQARTRVEAARVDVARFQTLQAQDENGLAELIGTAVPAEFLASDWSALRESLQVPAAGLSSALLLARPDILQAEQLLVAANANIGAARAAFFPRVILAGALGTASAELSGLFADGSAVWNFAPRVTVPIFDAGRNRANLAVAQADREIALQRYQQAIQTAFREVADALARRATIAGQLAAQQALVEASGASYGLATMRYEKGVDSYLTVLDSQRVLYTARQELIATDLTRLGNLTTLYRVLGGGAD
ncbi:MAG: efflux transporter outer membrane subunit [Desulfuromonadales bacterium]|nr:efflux transporter outer membrane subunit [Desulfuromonadales bacterium]